MLRRCGRKRLRPSQRWQRVAEGREGRGGVAAFALHAEGRTEDVVEHDAVLGGEDSRTPSRMRLVHVGDAAALHERQPVPEEFLCLGGQGADRPAGFGLARLMLRRRSQLAIHMVAVGMARLSLGDGEDLTQNRIYIVSGNHTLI